MPIITGVQVLLIAIPLTEPFRLGFGVLRDLPRVFLVLNVDLGDREIEAVGEASIDFPFSHYDAWDIYSALKNLPLTGRSLDEREQILDESWNRRQIDGCFAAQAALNMALDDALGQARGVSIHALYTPARTQGSILESIGLLDLSALRDRITEIYDHGRTPKLKCGSDVQDALQRLCLAREVARARSGRFAVDFNASLTPTAWADLCDQMKRDGSFVHELLFVEQPVSEDTLLTIQAHRYARETINIDVVADEAFLTEQDAQALSAAGIPLNFKIQKVGGIRQALVIEQATREACKPPTASLVGGTFPTAIGRAYDQHAACVLVSATLPSDGWQPATDWFHGERHLIHERFSLAPDGQACAFTGPGLGVSLHWKQLRHFVVTDPEAEYAAIRATGSGAQLRILGEDATTYAELYERITGRPITWNLTIKKAVS